jgi:glucose/arabinose dehydrogenase
MVPTTLPDGFVDSIIVDGLSPPTAMEIAPDGRIFIAEQNGDIQVVKDGKLLSQPFAHVNAFDVVERGLLGLVLDPNFTDNGYVYVYYTSNALPRRNVLSRFTASGDVADATGETVLRRFDPIDTKRFFAHVGGAMHFGTDGKLYLAIGDLGRFQNAQSLNTTAGKILRLNADGTIPADNPFYRRTKGLNRAIWAMGLRNPFTFAIQRETGLMYINDVGADVWEEVNRGRRGANYGWPTVKGPSRDRRFVSPVFAYKHGDYDAGDQVGCAVTGGVFYPMNGGNFPSKYTGKYFFEDLCNRWMRVLDPQTGKVTTFATDLDATPIDLDVDAHGNIYYMSRGLDRFQGRLHRISYSVADPPTITQQPRSVTGYLGETVEFDVSVAGAPPYQYQWLKNGVAIAGATSSRLVTPVLAADDGAKFQVLVSTPFGQVTSDAAYLTASANQRPSGNVTLPAIGMKYGRNALVRFAATATDPEDGVLGASSMTWQVDLLHNDHEHPILPSTTGISSGAFVAPVHHAPGDVIRIRIRLTVRDSGGADRVIDRMIFPNYMS